MKTMTYRCKGREVFQEGESLGRKDCGRDLSPLVLSVRKDGKIYKVKCPDCGNVGQVARTPE